MKNILRVRIIQILLALLIIFTIHTQVSTQSALARSSGGGKLAKFDTGKFALSVGIGLASSFVGNVVSRGIGSAAAGQGFTAGAGNAMSSYGSVGQWASSYNSMAALNQLGAGINMMGQQKGWDTSKTVFVSSVVQGAVGGGLNPSGTLGAGATASTSTTFKAMGVGAVSGVTEGAILANNVGSDGTINPWVSAGAGLAGSFVGGVASAEMATVVPKKEMKAKTSQSYQDYLKSKNYIYGPVTNYEYSQAIKVPTTTYHKAKTFGQALTHGAVKAFSAIPSSLVGVGVKTITEDMDKQDAFMVKQAFSGAYPIVGAVYKSGIKDPVFEKPVFEKIGLNNYVGHNGGAGTSFGKRNLGIDVTPKIGQ